MEKKEKQEKKREELDKIIQVVEALDFDVDLNKASKIKKEKVYFGYMRVSTLEQNVDRQKIALEKFASENKIKFKKIFEDFATGTNLNRPQLKLLLDQLREDDVIVCESYDRLCRSTLDLLSLMKNFEDKNVDFISIKENFNTSNAMGKLMLTMIAGLGEMERALMLERQAIGIQKARAEGKYKGRKPIRKPDNFYYCLDQYLNASKIKQYPFRQFLKDTNLKKSTLVRFIRDAKQNSLEKSDKGEKK